MAATKENFSVAYLVVWLVFSKVTLAAVWRVESWGFASVVHSENSTVHELAVTMADEKVKHPVASLDIALVANSVEQREILSVEL